MRLFYTPEAKYCLEQVANYLKDCNLNNVFIVRHIQESRLNIKDLLTAFPEAGSKKLLMDSTAEEWFSWVMAFYIIMKQAKTSIQTKAMPFMTSELELAKNHILSAFPHAISMYAFGSRVKGTERMDSDLDVAVLVQVIPTR